MEGLIGLFDDAISHRLIDRQIVEDGAVVGLETLLVRDAVEFVEAQAVVLAEIHRLLGDVLEDLTAREIADVAGVVVAHQQLGCLLGHPADAGHILLGPRGGLDLLAPAGSEIEGEILLQALASVEFREADRPDHRVIRQASDLLLHGAVDEPQISHQGAIAGLVDHPLEEAAHEAGVLGHGVGFLGSLTQLGSQGDRHRSSDDTGKGATVGVPLRQQRSRLRTITPAAWRASAVGRGRFRR